MQRIIINELDNTSNRYLTNVLTGSVFIPGFGDATITDVKTGLLIECTSLTLFHKCFGASAQTMSSCVYPSTVSTTKTLTEEVWNKVIGAVKFNIDSAYNTDDYCTYYAGAESIAAVYRAKKDIEAAVPFSLDNWELVIQDGWTAVVKGKYHTITIAEDDGSVSFVTLEDDFLDGFSDAAISGLDDLSWFSNTDKDPSYVMAEKLLTLGVPVVYVRVNENNTADRLPKKIYSWLTDNMITGIDSEITDKGRFNIQFITSGGYPVLEYKNNSIAQQMIEVAAESTTTSETEYGGRGDCVALLDHINNPHRPLVGEGSVYLAVSGMTPSTYAAVFTPWCNVGTSTTPEFVPASFVYLHTLASNMASNHTWDIFAGVGRGRATIVQSLNTDKTLSNRIAEYYQGSLSSAQEGLGLNINAITYINDYGYCIWGDRTLTKYTKGQNGFATGFLHMRNLVSEVKKQVYRVSQELLFNANNDVLWTDFKDGITSLLDLMVNASALTDYKFVKQESLDKTRLAATIILYPCYGLESVSVTLELDNSETSITEEGGNQ